MSPSDEHESDNEAGFPRNHFEEAGQPTIQRKVGHVPTQAQSRGASRK